MQTDRGMTDGQLMLLPWPVLRVLCLQGEEHEESPQRRLGDGRWERPYRTWRGGALLSCLWFCPQIFDLIMARRHPSRSEPWQMLVLSKPQSPSP